MAISQTTVVKSYGAPEINVHVPFIAPPPPSAACSTAKPIIGQLTASVSPTGGSIAGGQNLYYYLSSVDSLGNESIPSDPIEVIVPSGTNTNQVTISGISPFDANASLFHVYRAIGAPNGTGGTSLTSPAQLFANQTPPTNCAGLSVIDTGSNGISGGTGDRTKMPIAEDVNRIRAYWRLSGETQWRFGGETLNGQGTSVDFVVPHNIQGQAIDVQLRSVDHKLNETPSSLAPIASYTIAAAYPSAIGIGAAPPVGSIFGKGGIKIIDDSGNFGLGSIPDDPSSSRFAVLSVDANRRAIIDFTQAGHLSKNLDNIADTTDYIRGAQNAGSAIVLDNANFTAGTAGWSAFDANATISQISSSPFTNGKALQVSTASQFDGAQHNRFFKANPGDQFFMSCWINSDGTFQCKIQISYFDGAGTFLGSDGAFSLSTSWTQISFTGTAPANTASIRVALIRADAAGGTHVCWFTNPHVVRIASLDNEVADGDGAGGGTYQRMPIANMDSNRRGLIDFTQTGHLSKNLDNVADGSETGRAAGRWFYTNVIGATSGWVKLGTWVAGANGGSGDALRIEYIGGKGFNTNDGQQSHATIVVRTGNNTAAPNLSGISWWENGGSQAVLAVKAAATGGSSSVSNASWDIYVEFDIFTAGHYEIILTPGSTWTNSNSSSSDPGVASSTVVVGTGGLVLNAGATGLDSVIDGITYPRVANVNSDHTFHISTSLNNQASIIGSPAASVSYTSTTTSITWSWGAFTVYFPDGSTLAVSSGSQGFTSLTANTTYYFEFYVVKSAGTMTCVMSDNSTAPASVQFLAQTVGADGHAIEITDIAAATPSGGTGGGSGTGGTCFSGDTKIKTDKGFIRMDKLPAEFNIVNQTGTHRALRVIHTYRDDQLLVMPSNGLVTPGHMIQKGENWVPASELFSEKAPDAMRTLYDIQVVTGKPEDMHYILENGYVAHNKSRVSCFGGEARVLTSEGWIKFSDLPEKFRIVNSKGTFDATLFQHRSLKTNPPRMRLLPEGGTVTDDHIVRPVGETDWRHAEELLPASTDFPETVYNIISSGGYYRVGNLEACALEGNSR